MNDRRLFRGGSSITRAVRAGAAVLVLAALLSGCSWLLPSPKTSYVNEQGDTVTVDWRDFPGMGGTEVQAVLDGPTVEEGEARSTVVLQAVSAAISEHLGRDNWTTERSEELGPATWSQMENGYGGKSMLQIYNSHSWELEIRIPIEEWDALFDVAGAAASDLGLIDRYEFGSKSPAERWADRWAQEITYSHGTEFLSVVVSDASLDEEALRDAKEFGHATASVTLMFGLSAISNGDRAEFERRAEPFADLAHPELTD